jgi:hypothetical protein
MLIAEASTSKRGEIRSICDVRLARGCAGVTAATGEVLYARLPDWLRREMRAPRWSKIEVPLLTIILGRQDDSPTI